MKLALAMIVNGVDAEAKPFAQCLSSVAPHVDKVFATVTHKPGEEPSESVLKVCELYDVEVSHFEWVNDFAAARNYNFDQVPKEYTYILWLDADDIMRGVEKLKPTIEDNPSIDAFVFNYLYAFDSHGNPVVTHMKTQVVKNDGCVRWVGMLHEDFEGMRDIKPYFVKGIERIHTSTDERFDKAKERNLTVSLGQLEKEPDDPRSYWNVANSYSALGETDKALEHFDTFLKTSKSEEEKYIALLRVAENYLLQARHKDATGALQKAIGTKPDYPDAYYALADLRADMGKKQEAVDLYKMGMTKKAPIYNIMVYNPRDYDYNPMKKLAMVYMSMELPQLALPLLKGCQKIMPDDQKLAELIANMEILADKADEILKLVTDMSDIKDDKELKKALDKIPGEFQNHPAVLKIRNEHFYKKESSGKDLIFMCGPTAEEWTPETAKKKGIGGSEEAVIWLSKLLVKRGWNVTVYNKCGHKELEFDGVKYKPFWSYNAKDKQDVTIFWRTPRFLDYKVNSDRVYLDLHDVIRPGELTEERVANVDKIFVKSQWQRELFSHVEDEKFVIVPNGIDPKAFEGDLERDNNLVINTSAPNRSLSAYIEAAHLVKKECPDADIRWYYGWDVWNTAEDDLGWKNEMQARMKDVGIKEMGRVSHEEIARVTKKANVWLYPSSFYEIDCITASKCMAAGVMPVVTDFAAVGEKKDIGGYYFGKDVIEKEVKENKTQDMSLKDQDVIKEMAKQTIELIKNPPSEEERKAMRDKAVETFAWDKITDTWHSELSR